MLFRTHVHRIQLLGFSSRDTTANHRGRALRPLLCPPTGPCTRGAQACSERPERGRRGQQLREAAGLGPGGFQTPTNDPAVRREVDGHPVSSRFIPALALVRPGAEVIREQAFHHSSEEALRTSDGRTRALFAQLAHRPRNGRGRLGPAFRAKENAADESHRAMRLMGILDPSRQHSREL